MPEYTYEDWLNDNLLNGEPASAQQAPGTIQRAPDLVQADLATMDQPQVPKFLPNGQINPQWAQEGAALPNRGEMTKEQAPAPEQLSPVQRQNWQENFPPLAPPPVEPPVSPYGRGSIIAGNLGNALTFNPTADDIMRGRISPQGFRQNAPYRPRYNIGPTRLGPLGQPPLRDPFTGRPLVAPGDTAAPMNAEPGMVERVKQVEQSMEVIKQHKGLNDAQKANALSQLEKQLDIIDPHRIARAGSPLRTQTPFDKAMAQNSGVVGGRRFYIDPKGQIKDLGPAETRREIRDLGQEHPGLKGVFEIMGSDGKPHIVDHSKNQAAEIAGIEKKNAAEEKNLADVQKHIDQKNEKEEATYQHDLKTWNKERATFIHKHVDAALKEIMDENKRIAKANEKAEEGKKASLHDMPSHEELVSQAREKAKEWERDFPKPVRASERQAVEAQLAAREAERQAAKQRAAQEALRNIKNIVFPHLAATESVQPTSPQIAAPQQAPNPADDEALRQAREEAIRATDEAAKQAGENS